MDSPRDQFIDGIERQLTRLACDVILDPTPAAVSAAIDALAQALASGDAAELASRIRDIAVTTDAQGLAPVCEALWREWIAEDEVLRDVVALSADAELSGMFVAEALDHLGTIEATLLQLEDTPDDKTLLNDVFRPFHTIKGNAGALGVTTVQALAHQVENLLDRCRSGQHRVGSAEVDVVLKAVDLITAMLIDLSARIAGKPGTPLRNDRLVLVAAVERIIARGPEEPTAQPQTDSLPLSPFVDGAQPIGSKRTDEPKRAAAVRADAGESQASVKVDTRKLDGLVDIVGELVILQSLIYEDPAVKSVSDERFTRNLAQLRRITTDLQRGAMSMRMVPIRQTFQKMARLVRDLSKQSGKQVELTLAGEDTELDRKVVEDINDPLMHMVRNSMDHGLESREGRRAAGKRATGQLSLRAFHQGGSIVIEIADDGAGLNTDRIVAKAIANGLIQPDSALAPADIHQLIFAPGFSTAEQVTEISGRGVGMDVVKRNIQALRGRIDIDTCNGRGATFTITLPLTMAILDGLLVTVGAERFVIPTFAIRESLRPIPSQIHTVQGSPRLIQVRDELLPLVWLSDLFNVSGAVSDPTQGTVVVLEEAGRRISLVVDALIGKQEVVVKSLGAALTGIHGVAGGAILGDGRIGLILDAHGIVKLMDAGALAAA